MADPARHPPTSSAPLPWAQLAVLTAATLWTVTAEMLPSGLLPAMSRDLGVSRGTTGLLVSAWAITIALTGIPLMRATLRLPRRLLLTAALAATAAANLVTALAPGFATALAGRIAAAAAHGLFWALVVAYVASLVDPRHLGRALSVVLSGPTAAGLIGLPAGTALAEVIGWRAVFAVLSVILAATALLVHAVLPAPGGVAQDPGPARGRWDRSARDVLALSAAGALVLVGHFAAFTYVAPIITGVGGMPEDSLAVLLLAFGAASGLGVVAAGFASDRWPRTAVAAGAAAVAMGLGVLHAAGDDRQLFTVGVAVWGFAIGAFPPLFQARALSLSTPRFRPLSGSVVITSLNLGIALGAAAGGVLLHRGASAVVLAGMAAAAAGAAALLATTAWRGAQDAGGGGGGRPAPTSG